MSIVSVSHLSKHYRIHKKEPGIIGSIKSLYARNYETVKAVSDISFEIKEAELVGFIGPNGAGKTTTLKCLSGLLYPTEGNVSVLGFTPYNRQKEFLKQIALVMGQKNQLLWDLSPIDTFLLNKEIYDIPQERFDDILLKLSKLLNVESLLKVQVKKLSLGERMKMELIASIIHSPKVLFLDEPTIGLDVVMQKALREFIKEYNMRFGATIIITSHYMRDVEDLCERVIVINFGKIIFDGKLSELVKKYAPYKVISVIFRDYVDPKKLGILGEIKEFNYPSLTLRAKNEKIKQVASNILKNFPVEDLNIEDPSTEDVIAQVYTENRR